VLLVVDNSFSMRAGTRLTDAKDAAMGVLAGKGAARARPALRLGSRRGWIPWDRG
jgi:Mg-chelatase subunit ChlD